MKKIVSVLLVIVGAGAYLTGCQENSQSKLSEEGRLLAMKHCRSCHQFPEPAFLDKKTWANYVLPKMSGFLGFLYMDGGSYFENGKIPEAMPLKDWKKLVRYYITKAPEALERKKEDRGIQVGLNGFSPVAPLFRLQNPATTYVHIFPGQQQLLFADGFSQHLYMLSGTASLLDSLEIGEGIVNVRRQGNHIGALTMGVLHPSDEKAGRLTKAELSSKRKEILLDSLQRPVYIEYGQLNNDTLEDMVLCEFGNTSGQLSWYEGKSNNRFQKHVLRPLPGATRTEIVDANKDGKPDIIALMAQGDEGFFIYYNQGNGTFKEQQILQLPPYFGSNYFELADFNKDGHPDILATNGDNGDYPPILKAYHGIRIYMNNGRNAFKEKVFLSMNGASKAMARDFDGDGDLDIAAISYFPDYEHTPEESFIFWENGGNAAFRPYSFSGAADGRWLTMDAGDIDNDGDDDLVLGNAKFTLGYIPEELMNKWNKAAPSFLLLENKRHSAISRQEGVRND